MSRQGVFGADLRQRVLQVLDHLEAHAEDGSIDLDLMEDYLAIVGSGLSMILKEESHSERCVEIVHALKRAMEEIEAVLVHQSSG